MRYAKEYKAIKDGHGVVNFVEKYGLIAFLDEFMEDVEGRQERYEQWRKENKCCENGKWRDGDGVCEYWGDIVDTDSVDDGKGICSAWK